MSKRLNPYSRLLGEIQEFCRSIQHRHCKVMWRYPKNKLNARWTLGDLNERVAAAKQLGYEVHLESVDDGLQVVYKKNLPHIPWDWK